MASSINSNMVGNNNNNNNNNNINNTKNDNKKRWYPLEPEPTLMNNYISKLGFNTSFYQFVDVYSPDDWALETIPQPCTAVIMLYATTKAQEDWRKKEQLLFENKREKEDNACRECGDEEMWYIKETIENGKCF